MAGRWTTSETRSRRPRRILRRPLLAAVATIAVAVAVAPAAGAKSFTLPSARVEIDVRADGSVAITEHITFDYDGSFQGAYRDIPSRFGEDVLLDSIGVSEEGTAYQPGGSPVIGTDGPPMTYAVQPLGDGARIVWRYRATDERRTYTLSYVMTDLVRVHNDIVELNARVWGDQWEMGLGRLETTVRLPRPATDDERFRVWGHPRLDGEVARADDLSGASLAVEDVPAQQWVEMRVIFPREVLSSFSGATTDAPSGSFYRDNPTDSAFLAILAEEQALDEEAARRAEQLERIKRNLWWLIPVGLVALVSPAILIFVLLARRHGRDPDSDVDYVREPPSDDSPALVGALMREGGEVSTPEFLATFFDLIRRKYFRAEHETTEKKTWMGLKTEIISDLRVRMGDKAPDDLEKWDREVYDAVEWAIGPAGQLTSELGDVLKGKAKSFYKDFKRWQGDVAEAVARRGWIDKAGRRMWAGAIAIFAILFSIGVVLLVFLDDSPGFGLAAAVPGATNAALLLVLGLAMPKALTRRSGAGAELAARWDGLRRYLEDFSAMQEAPPASLHLWERLLVYAIVLGEADRVLEAAQLAAPAELAEQSDLFWIDGPGTGLGGGLTSLRMASLFAGVDRAMSAGSPSSGSSGFGGGFSGGGGFGGGGGGGGAW